MLTELFLTEANMGKGQNIWMGATILFFLWYWFLTDVDKDMYTDTDHASRMNGWLAYSSDLSQVIDSSKWLKLLCYCTQGTHPSQQRMVSYIQLKTII